MSVHVLDDYYLAITLLITIAYQLLFFSIAFTFKFDKLTGTVFPSLSTPRMVQPLTFPQISPVAPTSSSSPSSPSLSPTRMMRGRSSSRSL